MSNANRTNDKTTKRHRKLSAAAPKAEQGQPAEVTASMADALEDILRHESISMRVA